MRKSSWVATLVVAIVAGALSRDVRAQAPGSPAGQTQNQAGKLVVTVVDQTGGVLPNATVKVTPQDPAAVKALGGPPSLSTATTAAGVASLENLPPGRYTITAEFHGFETVIIKDYRVRAGENKRSVTLPIKKVAEDVVVGRDKQSSGLDPRGTAFSTVLTREQIAALPDDPDEMEATLKAMSPPGAVLRVDGFTGGKLPPKSQSRSIRLPRMDQMAAQNHGGINGMLHIDVMTQPGSGPIAGSFDVGFRDDALNAKNPFTPVKGEEALHQGTFSLNGSIVPNKSSFSLSLQQARLYDTGNILAAIPDGNVIASPIRRPGRRTNINARFDQSINAAHLMKFSYQRSGNALRNLGVGSYDLLERAYQTESSDNILRISENGAVGRRFFSESRLQVRWSDSDTRSAIEAPTVRVLDAFTSGGAQRRGGSRAIDFEAATDLDYVRGVHSMRAGVLLEGGRYRSDDAANYFGTYTFASLRDYEAGRPSNFTRRTGLPDVEYGNLQAGVYWQDDWRFRKSMLLSYGVRYEGQTIVSDWDNVSPRATLTWSPLKSGRTNFRVGAGWFNDWLATSTYEQTLRVDGFKQQEINITEPSYPDPGDAGTAAPSNRYQLSSTLGLPSSLSATAGIDQSLTPSMRVSSTYTFRRSATMLRGQNLNAPIGGVRPDPRFGNVVDVVNDGGSRTHMVGATFSLIKLNWKQTIVVGNYTWTKTDTNSTGPFSTPASGDDLSTEWGPAAPVHRFMGSFNMAPIARVGIAVNLRGQSGSPYNVTTGRDLNGDGVFNDRPAGVARNSARTLGQWDIGLRLTYSLGFGTRTAPATQGGGTMVIMGGGGGMAGGFGQGAADKRFQLQFYAAAQNLTNHDNYIGYSGVLSSPFFAQPTNVLNPRKIELGVRFGF